MHLDFSRHDCACSTDAWYWHKRSDFIMTTHRYICLSVSSLNWQAMTLRTSMIVFKAIITLNYFPWRRFETYCCHLIGSFCAIINIVFCLFCCFFWKWFRNLISELAIDMEHIMWPFVFVKQNNEVKINFVWKWYSTNIQNNISSSFSSNSEG